VLLLSGFQARASHAVSSVGHSSKPSLSRLMVMLKSRVA
jgi:hypothetical protein